MADTKLGVRTLPVILGEARARTVGAWLMILFYPLTALIVLVGLVGPWVLLIALGIPRLLSVLKVFDQPKPAGPPPGYPEHGWPLWFVGVRVHPHAPGRRPVHARPGPQRAGADPAALAVGARAQAGRGGRWARYSRKSSLVTTPAGRSPRTATSAGGAARQQRERLVERRRGLDQRERRIHDLADRPLDDGRVAVRPLEQALLADRADDAHDRVALGVLGDRQLADPVDLEHGDRVADPLGRPGDDDGRAGPGRGGGRRAAPRRGSTAPVVASRPLARIHSSL